MTISGLNAWIGTRYGACNSILILLESTYGSVSQHSDVMAWINGAKDATFEKLYRGCASASEGRLAWIDGVACMNLVPDAVGESNGSKVTAAQLRSGAATLRERLDHIKPRVVWIASANAMPYALPVVETYGVRIVKTIHPSRAPYVALLAAWAEATRVC